ncbi:MAG: hypothetical protein ABL949_13615 [Fimbriimonadaceae bacterium]
MLNFGEPVGIPTPDSHDDSALSSRGDRIDGRFSRCYFLIPFLDEEFFVSRKRTVLDDDSSERPCSHFWKSYELLRRHVQDGDRKVDDIVVFTHGWHRNLYGGVAAYDRLVSIFLQLYGRVDSEGNRKLDPLNDSSTPLFLGLHYHSDPGLNSWTDYGGRRNRDDFLLRVQQVIEPMANKVDASAMMTSDFETAFELFQKLCAPDVDPVSEGLRRDAERLPLSGYRLKGTQSENRSPLSRELEVLTVAWSCFHEAEQTVATSEQTVLPRRFIGTLAWLTTVGTVMLSLVPLTLVASQILKAFNTGLLSTSRLPLFLQSAITRISEGFTQLCNAVGDIPRVGTTLELLLPYFFLYLLLWLSLTAAVLRNRERTFVDGQGVGEESESRELRISRQRRGIRFLGNVCYIPLQIVHILPIVCYVLISPIFTTREFTVIAATVLGLVMLSGDSPELWVQLGIGAGIVLSIAATYYVRHQMAPERSGARGAAPIPRRDRERVAAYVYRLFEGIRGSLVWFAMLPIKLARQSARAEQSLRNLWDVVETQLAFWSMARKAADVGEFAARFLAQLFKDCDRNLKGARIHLVGHSHGGIVTVNLAKWLSYAIRAHGLGWKRRMVELNDEARADSSFEVLKQERVALWRSEICEQRELLNFEPTLDGHLLNVVTVNGAYMTNWFEGEDVAVAGIEGAIGCCFSKYDTANNFWYPLANMGRMSAGSVGHWIRKQRSPIVGEPLPSIALTTASKGDVDGKVDMVRRLDFVGDNPEKVKFLNIDCSRFVFKGSVLPQGAHVDIYKKDVVATIWRAFHFGNWRADQSDKK